MALTNNPMKYLLPVLGLLFLAGAGCTSGSTVNTKTAVAPDDPACTGNMFQNDAGAPVYPIAAPYKNFPHLGQIFTAIDCGNRLRATQVRGFTGEKYTAGIMFRWSTGAPPEEFTAVLTRMGFTEETKGAWSTREPLSMEDLLLLKSFLLDSEKNGGLENEDCVICG